MAFELTESDRRILALTDDEFVLHDWDNLVSLIGNSPSPPPLSLATLYL